MIDYHCFCQIKHLQAHQGLNASQIAQALSLDRRTVAYWLIQDHFRPRKPRPHASKLDQFKPDIVRLLERIPIRPRRSSSACASTALTAAMGWSKPMCARYDPGG